MKFQGQAAKNPPFGLRGPSQNSLVGGQQKIVDIWHPAVLSGYDFLIFKNLAYFLPFIASPIKNFESKIRR